MEHPPLDHFFDKKPAEKRPAPPLENQLAPLQTALEQEIADDASELLAPEETRNISAPEKAWHQTPSGLKAKILVSFLGLGLALGGAVQEAQGKSRIVRRGKGALSQTVTDLGRDLTIGLSRRSAQKRKEQVAVINQLRQQLRRIEREHRQLRKQLDKTRDPQIIQALQQELIKKEQEYDLLLKQLKEAEKRYQHQQLKDQIKNEALRAGRQVLNDIIRFK